MTSARCTRSHAHSRRRAASQFSCLHHIVEWPGSEGRKEGWKEGREKGKHEGGTLTSEKSSQFVSETTAVGGAAARRGQTDSRPIQPRAAEEGRSFGRGEEDGEGE